MKKKFRFGINMVELVRIVSLVELAMDHVLLTKGREFAEVPIVPGRPEDFGK